MKNFCLLLALSLATQVAPATILAVSTRLAHPTAERQVREVSPFTAISAAGSMRVILRQGSPQRVEVEASAADQVRVETEVRNGSLRIGRRQEGRKMWEIERFEGPVTVYVTAPTLTAVGVSGSGDLRVEGSVQAEDLLVSVSGSSSLRMPKLTARRLTTSVSGSGSATLGGSCPQHGISVSGSGAVQAANLRTDDTTVRVSGSGDARVNAAKTLTSYTSGSGSVLVSGNPQITSTKSGSGTVKRM